MSPQTLYSWCPTDHPSTNTALNRACFGDLACSTYICNTANAPVVTRTSKKRDEVPTIYYCDVDTSLIVDTWLKEVDGGVCRDDDMDVENPTVYSSDGRGTRISGMVLGLMMISWVGSWS
ncbi:hypothetical protein I302_106753 [Kwoniella bestiolae CBS 10118]|uniref:Uncharacterized protein n=1 Tax=Kwoniella bestiolae CBS 10118 TaxID=1296100 RepID=A0A1B9G0H5_9TREE|nr:hypothetical protein I302_05981 [Kwoniella bestiolae CBS 10118]OCF24521.1 hypothetical protein I302_05981 [Kwoniella bestiolae CBS 10118]